jgi:hypothetical protein
LEFESLKIRKKQGGDVLDLHGLSVPVASAAVRYTLKQTRK